MRTAVHPPDLGGTLTMTIRVGIIGTGLIGEDHGRKLASVISGATVSAVSDVNRARAEEVAAILGGARVFDERPRAHRSGRGRRGPRDLHRRDPRRVRPRVHRGRQAGHVREAARPDDPRVRGDPRGRGGARAAARHRRLHAPLRPGLPPGQGALETAPIGEALVLHNVHRNATVGEAYTSFMTMTDSMIHEVDTTRWLLGEEITAVQVIPPKRTPMAFPHLQDPQFAVFTHRDRDPVHRRVLRQLPVRL